MCVLPLYMKMCCSNIKAAFSAFFQMYMVSTPALPKRPPEKPIINYEPIDTEPIDIEPIDAEPIYSEVL